MRNRSQPKDPDFTFKRAIVRTPADTVGRLDGYLTKRVQDAFGVDSDAQVLELSNGNWTQWVFRMPGRADLRIGTEFRMARAGVSALCRSEFAKVRARAQEIDRVEASRRRRLGRL